RRAQHPRRAVGARSRSERPHREVSMELPTLLTLSDAEQAARAAVDPAVWAYVAGGAGSGATIQGNADAFGSFWLRPRVLGSRALRPETGITLFRQKLSMPLLLAPTSPQRL